MSTNATTAADNNNNSQQEPTTTVNNFEDKDFESWPLILKKHAFIRSGEYLPKFETFTFIDYYTLHVLRAPILKESIRYYEENYRSPIIIRMPEDGTIRHVKDKLGSLNEARATGSQHLLYPLKLQMRRFHNVSLDDIELWKQQIEEERQSFEDLDNLVPVYKDTEILVPGYEGAQLPLLDEWIGAISSSDWDRNQCAKLIAEATNDLGSLHEHTSTNPSMYALDQDDQLGHNQDDVFEHHHCSRWWCTGCYGTIQLPSVGNFYAGEKLTDDQLFTVPGNREKAESLSEILDLLQILNLNSIVMSVSDAMTREELAELSKALGLE